MSKCGCICFKTWPTTKHKIPFLTKEAKWIHLTIYAKWYILRPKNIYYEILNI
jgi:hypothetical protein